VRHAVEDGSRDLFDHVDLARHVSRAPGRHRHAPGAVDVEPESLEDRALLVPADVEPDQAICALGPNRHAGPLREPVVHVYRADRLGSGKVHEEAAREHGRRLRRVGVDALLPLVRALGPQPEAFGRLEDPDWLEVRRLEQHLRGRLGDLRL
jgi:hypothetical protein